MAKLTKTQRSILERMAEGNKLTREIYWRLDGVVVNFRHCESLSRKLLIEEIPKKTWAISPLGRAALKGK